mgnify:FL=1
MKIVVVGTFPPYRGGISNFYQTLFERLSQNHNVTAINFSLQYPSILFPGKSQYDNNLKSDFKIERIINSINPITWKKAATKIIDIKPDIVIFKYWMPFFAPSFGSIIRDVKKSTNIKSLVICDNIIPHESRFFDNILTKYFFKYIDYFIVMSKSVENDLLTLFPNAKYSYTPHPLYDIFGKSINKDLSKRELKIKEGKLILFFGLIRPYKGLDLLIEAANIIKNKLTDFKILAIGDCYDNPEPYSKMIDKYKINDIFDLRFEFVPNDKVHLYFSASDVIVLPYKSATQSGIVPVAYHFNKPVIVTNVGGLSEIVQQGNTGYIVEPDSTQISDSIIKFYNDSEKINFKENIKLFNKNFTWEKFIKVIEDVLLNE